MENPNELQPIANNYDANDLFKFVEQWAFKRGLINPEYAYAQMLKVMEEVGETASALAKKDQSKIIDGIGDCFVTLIVLSAQLGLSPTECLNAAYSEIRDRTGKLQNGTYIKD
jgi:phosphoribosyl-ATP pyrophosphohydrolase